ncbi:hypothetical protein [Metabacillus fastidiosus]|uniref:hypothetical protein n=1 Tax=Metabacillus fastidiosus TaxID=1458 RepID=UPI003D292789
MNIDEIRKQYERDMELKKRFNEGFRRGEESAKQAIRYNKMMSNLLLEFIGYEDEWLTTKAGYNKFNKAQLIEIIFKQRDLMRTLYNDLDESKKEKLKIKVEKDVWTSMYED